VLCTYIVYIIIIIIIVITNTEAAAAAAAAVSTKGGAEKAPLGDRIFLCRCVLLDKH